MAVLARIRAVGNQLLTLPILKAIESFSSADFDAVLRNLITSTTSSYIVSGLTVNINSNSFSSTSNNLTINTLNAVILNSLSQQSGTIFTIPGGTTADALNPTNNSRVVGNFSANAVNYISLEYTRVANTGSSDTAYLYNDTLATTIQRTQYFSTILDYQIFISTTAPPANQILIAEVTTNTLNVPTLITDCRPLLFRLGSGGITPNPFFSYSWPQGRTENSYASSSPSVNSFYGGDKAIGSFKDWMNAIMSSIKEIRGTNYWYSPSGGSTGQFSLQTVAEDAVLSYVTSAGSMHYNAATAGDLWWDSPLYIRSMLSSQYYKINSVGTGSLVMSDQSMQYVSLNRYQTLASNVSFSPSLTGIPAGVVTAAGSNGALIVSGVSPVFQSMTSGVSGNTGNGDFIKAAPDSNANFAQVLAFFDNTGATNSAAAAYYAVLNTAYTGSIGTQSAEFSQTYYGGSSVTVAPRASVLNYAQAGNIYWLAFRDNTLVYTKFFGEMYPGEDRVISSPTSTNFLEYTGSPNESTTIPNYSSTPTTGAISANSGEVNYSGVSTDNLTMRTARNTSMAANHAQNKNIAMGGGGTVLNSSGLVSWNSTITVLIGGPTGLITNWAPAGSANVATTSYNCAYVTINRNVNTSLNISLTTADQVPLSENVYVIARNFVTSDVYFGLDGQSYIIANNGSSSTGVNPAPATALGIADIHKSTEEFPAGTINGINTGFTITQAPYSSSALILFKNGLFQTQSIDYTISNQQITMTVAPNTGDQLAAVYWMGNSVPYSYWQGRYVTAASTVSIAYTPGCSWTKGLMVCLDGLLRQPGASADYIAGAATITFNYTLTTGSIVDLFYTGSGDNLIASQGYFNQASTSTRTYYSFYNDFEGANSVIVAIDGVAQFQCSNTINASSIVVNDWVFISPSVFQLYTSNLNASSTAAVWGR